MSIRICYSELSFPTGVNLPFCRPVWGEGREGSAPEKEVIRGKSYLTAYDMPTIQQCLDHYGEKKFYVQSGFDRFKNDNYVLGMPTSDWEILLNSYRVTPIISDPTNVDSDGDGYADGSNDVLKNGKFDDPRPLICDVEIVKLSNPELLIVTDGVDKYYGANQGWLGKGNIISKKGCGIVAVANIFSYMAGYDSKYADLFSGERTKSNFVDYVSEISDYLKIGPFGIWGVEHISEGATDYAKSKGISLQPTINNNLFNIKYISDYIREGLKNDKPVAMLIGINSKLQKVETFGLNGSKSINSINTHWVTITEFEIDKIACRYTVKVSTWGEYAYVDLFDYICGEVFCAALVYFN